MQDNLFVKVKVALHSFRLPLDPEDIFGYYDFVNREQRGFGYYDLICE